MIDGLAVVGKLWTCNKSTEQALRVCCRLFGRVPIWHSTPMSVAPSPSGAKGEVKLQPSYFTSSLYVTSFRQDVLQLVDAFREQFSESLPTQPFALFKSIWNSQGWTWIHLRVFDARAREAFLNVTTRLFLGMHRTAIQGTHLNSLQKEQFQRRLR